ncbi:hypothetical protein K488DRAFT_84157 [Vararia minispora EC-137]|uniref:Uncharacterized protein n=1 Tax=Vararia minispora EC-137 TaxID=1314806 RepID=A0ACB8QR29_9AGAM|nr:hypothetical protein K488DRAFT_84157 [Vararia minispora EC-137]
MLSRDDLEHMKRAELQRLCKSFGIRANLKSEELVELLLQQETSKPPRYQAPSIAPTPPPLPSRVVSNRIPNRTPGTRSRLQSGNSVAFHSDIVDAPERNPVLASVASPRLDQAADGPATRTRKSKDTQYRLGVGRPAIAGGSGARSVTKSANLSKLRRGKPSKSGRPVEATILEDPFADAETPNAHTISAGTKASFPLPSQATSIPPEIPTHLRPVLCAYLDEKLQPLNNMISSLRAELQEQAVSHQTEVASLKGRLETMAGELEALRLQITSTIGDLNGSVERLQAELVRARKSSEPLNDATLRGSSPRPFDVLTMKPAGHDLSRTIRAGSKFEYPPPPSTKKASKESGYYALGKRPRPPEEPDPGPSRLPNLGSSGRGTTEPEERHEASRSSRKRLRIESETAPVLPASPTAPHEASAAASTALQAEPLPSTLNAARPGFTVYVGPEESFRTNNMSRLPVDEPFFTDSDFDFFDSRQPARQGGTVTSTASAAENHPFVFTFTSQAGTTTPTAAVPVPAESEQTPVISTFPFPQAPHSPSPAPIHRPGVRPDRPDSSRPTGIPAESTNGPSIPAVLPRTPPPNPADSAEALAFRRVAGTDIGFALPSAGLQTPTGPAGRTMYGTELEVDRRFGDFGFDGVASGFWSGSSGQ